MPDWTFLPLRPVAARTLGPARADRLALSSAAMLAATRAGRALIATVGGTTPPAGAARTVDGLRCASPVVVRIGAAHARDALRVLPALGAGLIEIGPVAADQVPGLRAALAGRPDRSVPVVLSGADDVLAALADRTGEGLAAVDVDGPDAAVRAVAGGATLVAIRGGQLAEEGPALIGRITEAIVARQHGDRPEPLTPDPRRWPGWAWAMLTGLGMIGGGLGAAVITLGPVLLWYDQAFLGAGLAQLARLSPHLVGFIRHDRMTLAGSMVATGVLYLGLGAAMRVGWDWARIGLLASGLVGFPTLAYFLAWGFLEPLHTLLAAILLPIWVAAVRRPVPPSWRVRPVGPEAVRRRALVGQLGLVALGFGLAVGGIVISVVGLTDVFVPSDLVFLQATPHHLTEGNPRLLGFIAHDRAGFGGVLLSVGVAITWLALRGWRRGAAGTWWTLTAAAGFGWLPALAIHTAVGYLDVVHLLPVYAGLALTAVSLGLARPYLCASGQPDRPSSTVDTELYVSPAGTAAEVS
jgi:hypothetical protein